MTVVLVHGNPETPVIWDRLAAELHASGYGNAVRLSPPGFGAPLPDEFVPTPDSYRDWLVGELEGFDEPVDLVGHDWGGVHVANVAMHRPELVRSWASDAFGVLEPDYRWHPLAQIWQTPGAGEEWVADHLSLSTTQRTEVYRRLGIAADCARQLAGSFDRTMADAILALYRAAAQPTMLRIGERLEAAARSPGLAFVAGADPNVGTDAQRRRAAARAGAQLCELPQAGHWWMTHPGESAAGVAALTGLWDAVGVSSS